MPKFKQWRESGRPALQEPMKPVPSAPTRQTVPPIRHTLKQLRAATK